MKTILYTLAFLLVSLVGAKDGKPSALENRRLKTCWEIFHRLEKGLMGERDYAKAVKLLEKAKGVERSWLAMCIGQYHRELRDTPADGIKLLIGECLGDKAGRSWARKLATAERTREAEYRQTKAKAIRKKQDPPEKPSGLAIALPPLNDVKVSSENVPAVLELSRCLGAVGDVHGAIKLIDKCGKTLQSDQMCLMLAYEALADLNSMNREYMRAASGYKTALKVFGSLKKRKKEYGEGFTQWESAARARVQRKLDLVNRLIEAEKYGKGWVDYRDAEVARRKNKDSINALHKYDAIMKDHPKTVYESAARCYSIKCLLELAKLKKPRRGQDKSLAALEKKLTDAKNFLKLAKRNKVPEAGLAKAVARVKDANAKIARLKAVPYGEKALAEAKARAKTATKRVWALYNGEILVDIGSYCLEYDLDEKGAEFYLKQAANWFANVAKVDKTLSSYRVPGKAMEVTIPVKNAIRQDKWGNIEYSEFKIGEIFNRKTCPWYEGAVHAKALVLSGFVSFIKEELDVAKDNFSKAGRIDPRVTFLKSGNMPNMCRRLVVRCKDGAFRRATKEDLKCFPRGKKRMAIFLADFFAEIEEPPRAMSYYDALQKGRYGKLTGEQEAYIRFGLS